MSQPRAEEQAVLHNVQAGKGIGKLYNNKRPCRHDLCQKYQVREKPLPYGLRGMTGRCLTAAYSTGTETKTI